MRQTSLRNQRSKGLRARHIIQLCVLTAVCMWLLYQLKHSYDKRRVMDEQDAKISRRVSDGGIDIFKLGRKDLPHLEEIHKKEDEHGEVEEEEEEHETKQEPKDEELRGVGDDEMDGAEEQDQEKDGGEGEHEEESATEEEKDFQVEGKDLLNEEEHEGNSQEAREEHYKKDDASSAVHHDTHTAETEGRNEERVENKESDGEMEIEAKEKVVLNGEMETEVNEKVDLSNNSTFVENGTLMGNGSLSNSTLGEHESQTELNPNTSALTNSSNQMELKTGITDLPTDQIQTRNNTIALDRNSTLDTGTTEKEKPNMAGALIKFTEKSNTSNNGEGGEGGSSNPSQTEESNTGEDSDTAQRKSSGPLQTENTNTSENGDAAQGEHVDPSHDIVTSEEKEAHTDPSTLSSIQTEAKNGENKAAE